jgi:hypothetical protein
MSISFVASTNVNSFDADQVVSKPTGVVANDVMLAVTQVLPEFGPLDGGTVYPNEVTASPAGWVELAHTDWEESTSSHRRFYLRLWRKVAGASEPADYTFTLSDPDTDGRGVRIAAWRGVNTSTPTGGVVSAVTNAAGLPDTTLDIPSLTTTGEDRLLVVFGARALAAGTVSIPSFTVRASSFLAFVLDKTQAAAGASGIQTLTHSTSMTRGAFMTALIPLVAEAGLKEYCNSIDAEIN